MPYPLHPLFVFGGTIDVGAAAGGEIWQCGVRGAEITVSGTLTPQQAYEAALDAILPRLTAWWANPANGMANVATLTFCKLNQVGPDGKYTDRAHTHFRTVTGSPRGPVTTEVPALLTLAISWTTALQRGPGHTGRIYPPLALTSIDREQVPINNQNVTRALAAGRGLLSALWDGASGMNPAVVSGVGTGAIVPITGVRVGNVVDVQRRRKNAPKEQYAAATWPA